jgi:protein-arginine kinase activator protein McsA
MLCEICQKKEATCHLCAIVDGVSESKDLCEDCYKTTTPQFGAYLAAHEEAHCEYCDGQPCVGGTDILALATGVQKLKFMCMPCSIEHNRYVQQRLQGCVEGLAPNDEAEFIRKLDRAANVHMRQWVSDARSR